MNDFINSLELLIKERFKDKVSTRIATNVYDEDYLCVIILQKDDHREWCYVFEGSAYFHSMDREIPSINFDIANPKFNPEMIINKIRELR